MTAKRPDSTRRLITDRIGDRYGDLVIVGVVKSGHNPRVLVRCDCGTTADVPLGQLLYKGKRTCGCDRGPVGCQHPAEYYAWAGMKDRCRNPNNRSWHRYGGRGISVCARWHDSFASFFEDMGPRPTPQHSIDRIDNDGNYEPGNCRWATRAQQMSNTSRTVLLTHNGMTMTVSLWAKKIGVSYQLIQLRLARGLPIEQVLAPRSQSYDPNGTRITVHGVTLSMGGWARRSGVSRTTIRRRLLAGLPPEQVVSSERWRRD